MGHDLGELSLCAGPRKIRLNVRSTARDYIALDSGLKGAQRRRQNRSVQHCTGKNGRRASTLSPFVAQSVACGLGLGIQANIRQAKTRSRCMPCLVWVRYLVLGAKVAMRPGCCSAVLCSPCALCRVLCIVVHPVVHPVVHRRCGVDNSDAQV